MNSEGFPATYNVPTSYTRQLLNNIQVGNASLHYNTSVYDVHDIVSYKGYVSSQTEN